MRQGMGLAWRQENRSKETTEDENGACKLKQKDNRMLMTYWQYKWRPSPPSNAANENR